MSGIENIKKKAKLSMDEMYDKQSVGNLAIQKDGLPEIQQAIQMDIQPENHLNVKTDYLKTNEPEKHLPNQPTIQPTNHISKEEEKTIGNLEKQFINLSAKQQIPKPNNYKMTFNLTEESYKSFNNLYAKRMIEGRKTDKSDMICEAINYLLLMESGNEKS